MKQNQQNNKPNPRTITLRQFLRYFEEQQNRKFCFILGAGASKSSGIPTGAELARQWLNEIEEDLDEDQFKAWLKEERIDKNEPASFYHQIFAKRFEVDHQGGYDFFEKIMEKAEPSCGYSFLAEILAQGKHDIVITTNFDSLTEDALFIYTAKKPLVIGHADLAGFINIQLQRPQVIKVHHDLFFSPQNTEDETGHIDEQLERGLQDIFQSYIPIVIGYGGNDGGFMDVLKRVLDPDKGIYWCFTGKEHPKGEIEELVIDKQGCFIPITDFDELMVLLGEKIGIGSLKERIQQIADERVERYGKQMQGVYNKINDGLDLPNALDRVLKYGNLESYLLPYNENNDRSDLLDALDKILKPEKPEEPNWLTYGIQAKKETDPEKIESIYKEGLEKCPDSHELMNDYAVFLQNIKKDYAQAEKYYQKALALKPDDVMANYNYAVFLTLLKKDYAQAEKDYLQAEKYYQKALVLEPDDTAINHHYALFLALFKRDYAQAEKYYQKALVLEPDDAAINHHYAVLLAFFQKDYAQAEKYYQKALALKSDDATINRNYAVLLALFKKDYAQAEKYYQKALALEPNGAANNSHYALFLTLAKKDYAQAEEYYQKALTLEPNDADINHHYALFLLQQGYFEQAKIFIDKAFQHIQPYRKELELSLWFYRYACFYQDYPESKSKVESLLQDGIRSPGWPLEGLLKTVKQTVQHPEYDQVAELARQISEV